MTKMAKWNTGTESGILRKKVVKDKHEDLLVFGYACKLFRDDEKALYIDQGKHLIPWMAEENLKIDRYDCRGALSELHQYEASREDYDVTRWLGLSDSERRIELLCDEERYYALKNNEEELEMYKEEELKRLHQKRSEIQYNYDVPTDPENSEEIPEAAEEEDEAFVLPPELDVPSDVEVPKTVKENSRIEKTALFVSKQGLQMEILIKTKQADNPQFSFMNKDDPLYKYYKHLLMAIKSGQYKVRSQSTDADQKLDDSNEQDGNEDHYLHPSLFATSLQSAPPPLPTVIYKPSADCSYSQLVNRIQGTQSESATPPPQPATAPEVPQTQMTYEQQQQYYQQYYYAAQYYEYYKQMAQQFQGQTQDKLPPEAAVFAQNQVYAQGQTASNPLNFVQNQAAYTQYLQQQQSTNPYAQIVSNLSHNKDMVAAYSSFMQTDLGQSQVAAQNSDITKAPILYNQSESQNPPQPVAVQEATNPQVPQATSTANIVETKSQPEEKKPDPMKKPLLSLAQYGSDSDNGNSSEDEQAAAEDNVKVPPGETKQIIDKMASYVVKNGKDFENIVRSKGDPRFEFLNESHKFHSYYRLKMKEYSGELPTGAENGDSKDAKEQHNGLSNKPKEKKIITPVSFSIKKPKDEVPKEIKSALPVEESDDDQEEDVPAKTPPAAPSINAALPPATTIASITTSSSASATTTASSLNTSVAPAKVRPTSLTPPPRLATVSPPALNPDRLQDGCQENKELPEENGKKSGDSTEKSKAVDADDLILEMIDLTDDLEERRETRRAEDRKKDKIAAAAREKLALQLERKKKAAAFLKLKSVETKPESTKSGDKTQKSSRKRSEKSREDSEASRHSTPKKAKISKVKEKVNVEVLKIDDSESEEGEIRKHKKSSKKKKSHKRKHSRSRHESKGRHKSKEHKKSKKKRKRSESGSSRSSVSSQ